MIINENTIQKIIMEKTAKVNERQRKIFKERNEQVKKKGLDDMTK